MVVNAAVSPVLKTYIALYETNVYDKYISRGICPYIHLCTEMVLQKVYFARKAHLCMCLQAYRGVVTANILIMKNPEKMQH